MIVKRMLMSIRTLAAQRGRFTTLLGSLVVVLVILHTTTHAQPVVDWLKVGGTVLDDTPSCMVRGPSGEFFLVGRFGAPDGFSAEASLFTLDPDGNEISRQPWRGADIVAVAVDPKGNYYLTGSIRDPDLLGVGRKHDFYLAKHASDGTLLWERTGGTLRSDGRNYQDDGQAGNAILLDAQGNVLAAGRSQGPAVYGAVALPNTLGGPVICKYSPDGTLLWIKRVEGSRRWDFGMWFGYGEANRLLLDAEGNILIGGTMTDGRADFGGIVVTIDGYWDYGPFTAKYNPGGDVLWVKTTGAVGAVDRHGNVYASDIYSGDLGYVNTQYKYDPTGGLIWKRTLSGMWLMPVAVNARGEPIYSGSFTGTVQIDGHVLQNDSQELNASFVGKADAEGRFQWVVGGTSGGVNNHTKGVLCEPSGGIYVSGSRYCQYSDDGPICDGIGSFGPFPLDPQIGGSDFFLARITDPTPVAVELKITSAASGLSLSWPATATGFVLESSNTFPASNWTPVDSPRVVQGNENVVNLNFEPGTKFFRLRKL